MGVGMDRAMEGDGRGDMMAMSMREEVCVCVCGTTGGVWRSDQSCEGGFTEGRTRLQSGEFSEFAMEAAAGEGPGGIVDGAAPVSLDGPGGTAGAGEEEGEGVAEGGELV